MWPFDSQVAISYRCSSVTKSPSPTVSEIPGTEHVGVTTRVTWRHRSRDHSIPRWSFPIGAPLSPNLSAAIFEIMGTKHIGVMTLTFHGHVTSPVTWTLGSGWVISYRWSFGPKSLSLTVSEIGDSAPNIMCWVVIAHERYRVMCTPMQNLSTYFNFSPPLCLHCVTSSGLRWRIRVFSLWTTNVKGQIVRKFLSPKICEILTFWVMPWRSGGMKCCDFCCKRHILAWIHVVWAILREGPLGSDPQSRDRKSQKVSDSHRNDCVAVKSGLALPRSLWCVHRVHRVCHVQFSRIWCDIAASPRSRLFCLVLEEIAPSSLNHWHFLRFRSTWHFEKR